MSNVNKIYYLFTQRYVLIKKVTIFLIKNYYYEKNDSDVYLVMFKYHQNY